MKNFHLILLSVFLPASLLHAQYEAEMTGMVVEQNSQFNTGEVIYIENATIESPGAAESKLSQEDGNFVLQYVDIPPGEVAQVEVRKKGYIVVNEEALRKADVRNLYGPVKVVMCRRGQFYENQLDYYYTVWDASMESYKRKLAILQEDSEKSGQLIAKMGEDFRREIKNKSEAIALLKEEVDKVENRAYDLSEKWSGINLDDQSGHYQRAFRAFMDLDIELALAILDSADLEYRLETDRYEIEQDIQQCIFKAELHELNFEYAQAEKYFELAVRFDAENVETLSHLNAFLYRQNQAESLILYAHKMLRLTTHKEEEAEGLVFLAIGLHDQKEDSLANLAYEEASEIYRVLVADNPDRYEADLATTLTRFGNTHADLKQHPQALFAFKEALEIRKSLAKENPDRYETYVAQSLNSLGLAFFNLNDFSKADSLYKEAYVIFRKRSKDNPQRYAALGALILNNQGMAYAGLNSYTEAIAAYEQALKMSRKLMKVNPRRYASFVAKTLNNLGLAYHDIRRSKAAISSLEEALKVYRKLAEAQPQLYKVEVALALNNLGLAKDAIKRYPEALLAYYEALGIYEEMTVDQTNPYEAELANTLNNIGNANAGLKRFSEAFFAYEEALRIRRKLTRNKPGYYEMDLARTLNNLGLTYADLNRYNEARQAYQEALGIYQGRLKDHPDVRWSAMGDSYYALGKVEAQMFRFADAIRYFQLADSAYARNRDNLHAKSMIARARDNVKDLSRVDALAHAWSSKGFSFVKEHNADSANYYFEKSRTFYDKVPFDDLDIQGHYNASILYERLTILEAHPQKNYAYMQKVVRHREPVVENYSDEAQLTKKMAFSYSQLSRYALFVENFSEAEDAARRTLKLSPQSTGVISYLAAALLYQGHYEEALSYYQEWKDKEWPDKGYGTFCKAFYADLHELEAAGITHPDVEKVKAELGGCEE